MTVVHGSLPHGGGSGVSATMTLVEGSSLGKSATDHSKSCSALESKTLAACMLSLVNHSWFLVRGCGSLIRIHSRGWFGMSNPARVFWHHSSSMRSSFCKNPLLFVVGP